MRMRRLKYLKDRTHYALDKKMLKLLNWEDGDEIVQIPNGHFIITLLNKTKRNREYKDYEKFKGILEILDEREFKRQKAYNKIKKKYSINSKSYKQALAKFNRGFLSEDEAMGKKPARKKIFKDRIKQIDWEIERLKLLKEDCTNQLNKNSKKVSS